MISRKIGVLLSVAIGVGALLGLAIRAFPESTSRQAGSAELSVVASQSLRPAAAESVAVQAASPGGAVLRPSSARLQKKLSEAGDWRAFALEAKQHPEEGGYLYAMYVANQCGVGVGRLNELAKVQAAKTIKETGTVSQAQLDAAGDLSRRCGAFVPGEAAALTRELRELAGDRKDPLLNASRALGDALKAAEPVAVRVALQDLLDTSDPLAISKDLVLERAMHSSAEAKASSSLYFDGQMYASDDYARLRLATDLALCSADQPCALREQMALSCMSGGVCEKMPADYVRAQFNAAGMSPDDFSKLVQLGERVRSAIEARKVDAFVR